MDLLSYNLFSRIKIRLKRIIRTKIPDRSTWSKKHDRHPPKNIYSSFFVFNFPRDIPIYSIFVNASWSNNVDATRHSWVGTVFSHINIQWRSHSNRAGISCAVEESLTCVHLHRSTVSIFAEAERKSPCTPCTRDAPLKRRGDSVCTDPPRWYAIVEARFFSK